MNKYEVTIVEGEPTHASKLTPDSPLESSTGFRDMMVFVTSANTLVEAIKQARDMYRAAWNNYKTRIEPKIS